MHAITRLRLLVCGIGTIASPGLAQDPAQRQPAAPMVVSMSSGPCRRGIGRCGGSLLVGVLPRADSVIAFDEGAGMAPDVPVEASFRRNDHVQ